MTQSKVYTGPASEYQEAFLQYAAWGGIVGPILFVLVFTLDGFLQPGYSSMSQMISWLALRPNGWIQNSNFIVFGLLLVFFAISFFQRMYPIISKKWLSVCSILLFISAAGWTNDGFFVSDAPGASGLTFHGMMHDIGFLVIFSSLVIAFFFIGRQLLKVPAWRTYGWYSLTTGIVALGLFFVLIYTSIRTPQLTGLANRLLIIETIAWYVVMGYHFLAMEWETKHNKHAYS